MERDEGDAVCEESWRRGGTEKHGWEKGRQKAREDEKSTERKGGIRRVGS